MLIYGAQSTEEAELAEYAIDVLFGYGYVKQDIPYARTLLAQCPCLSWLHKFTPHKDDLNALYKAGNIYAYGIYNMVYGRQRTAEKLFRFANLGRPYSQVTLYIMTKDETWIKKAMNQHYARAYFIYGFIKEDMAPVRKSIRMGNIAGMVMYSEHVTTKVERAYWLCKAYIKSRESTSMAERIYRVPWEEEASIQIGYMCKDDFQTPRARYMEKCDEFEEKLKMWTLCARRMRICKDVRLIISKMLWNQRIPIL